MNRNDSTHNFFNRHRGYLITAICLLMLFGITMRLLPHPPNMTPLTAIAFTASLYLGRRWTIVLPGTALLASDVIIGFYDWKIMLSVYGSFALIGLLSLIVTKRRAILPVGLGVISASLLFFFITNGAVWAFSPWYEHSISGLMYSYQLGLPFLRNMLIGDVLYTILLITAFESWAVYDAIRDTSDAVLRVTGLNQPMGSTPQHLCNTTIKRVRLVIRGS